MQSFNSPFRFPQTITPFSTAKLHIFFHIPAIPAQARESSDTDAEMHFLKVVEQCQSTAVISGFAARTRAGRFLTTSA